MQAIDTTNITAMTKITWKEVSEERYWDMLEVLPPAVMGGGGFMVGEPSSTDPLTGQLTFRAFRKDAGKYYEAVQPLTIKTFRMIVPRAADYAYSEKPPAATNRPGDQGPPSPKRPAWITPPRSSPATWIEFAQRPSSRRSASTDRQSTVVGLPAQQRTAAGTFSRGEWQMPNMTKKLNGRRWRVTYASGAVATIRADDYAGAVERAKQISPRLTPVSIVLID